MSARIPAARIPAAAPMLSQPQHIMVQSLLARGGWMEEAEVRKVAKETGGVTGMVVKRQRAILCDSERHTVFRDYSFMMNLSPYGKPYRE